PHTDVARPRGLTMFLLDVDTEGVEVQPVWTVGGDRTNITFYTDVRVADHWRIGEVDGGWEVMKVALAYERGALGNTNQAVRLLAHCRAWAATRTRPAGTRARDDPPTPTRRARMAVESEVRGLLS